MMNQSISPAPYVFLSYASVDREQATSLARRLEAVRIPVWFDRDDIVGGASWDAAIVRGIAGSTALVLLCSGAAMRSPNVGQELRLAWEEHRPVVPLILQHVSYPEEVRYILAGRQWVDASDGRDELWFARLLDALAGLGVSAGTPAPPTVPGSEPATGHSLPLPLTSIVGREGDLNAVGALLRSHRLVTLLGPGGTGKTRLALEVARAARDFPDGVAFVPLAGVGDPALVLPAIAQALGVREVQGQPLARTLAAFLEGKRMLLVLDNMEQIIDAAGQLSALIEFCPTLTLLVTSRVALRIAGEREYLVEPLPVPDPAGHPSLTTLAANPAVALFVQRAADSRPGFALSEENAAPLSAIAARLDGLPLALELAAARVRVLSPASLLARLDNPLKVLAGGDRSLPERQQTLRRTVQWSYDLLTPAEQMLFRRLAVFAGGWTLEAAEAVCTAEAESSIDVLDGIDSLTEKSLLRRKDEPGDEPRFAMLETIREFAQDRLTAAGERADLQRRHAAHFLGLAEDAESAQDTSDAQRGRARLRVEQENVRAALEWAVEQGEAETAARLVVAMHRSWLHWGALSEGRAWAEASLALPRLAAVARARADVLWVAGRHALALGDTGSAQRWLAECVALERATGGGGALARALAAFGWSQLEEPALARPLLDESAALFRAAGDAGGLALALYYLGNIERQEGNSAAARSRFAESLALARSGGDRTAMARPLTSLAALLDGLGEGKAARPLYEEALQLFREADDSLSVASVLGNYARLLLREGDEQPAAQLLAECLLTSRRLGAKAHALSAVEIAGWLSYRRGDPAQAARLFGAAESIRAALDIPLLPAHAAIYRAGVEAVRAASTAAAYERARTGGSVLSLDQAITEALAVCETARASANTPAPSTPAN